MFSTRRRWTGSSSTMRMNSDMNAPRDATSAVVLTFRSVSLQPLSSERQNQNRTSTLELLVSLCFRRSHETVPQSDASVGSGTPEVDELRTARDRRAMQTQLATAREEPRMKKLLVLSV